MRPKDTPAKCTRRPKCTPPKAGRFKATAPKHSQDQGISSNPLQSKTSGGLLCSPLKVTVESVHLFSGRFNFSCTGNCLNGTTTTHATDGTNGIRENRPATGILLAVEGAPWYDLNVFYFFSLSVSHNFLTTNRCPCRTSWRRAI